MSTRRQIFGDCTFPGLPRCGTAGGYNQGCRGDGCYEAFSGYREKARDVLGAIRVLARAGDWVDDAACRTSDSELFFPERGEDTATAKAVCRGCTVIDECLEYALTNGERFGVWGGKSERERRRMRRDRRAA